MKAIYSLLFDFCMNALHGRFTQGYVKNKKLSSSFVRAYRKGHFKNSFADNVKTVDIFAKKNKVL